MDFKNLKAVERNAPAFASFKRFEEKDVVNENGKSVVYIPGKVDSDKTLEKLKNEFMLMQGEDENKKPCLAVVRKVSKQNPAFKSEFPVSLDESIEESENILKKENKNDGPFKGLTLLAFIYPDKVVSPNRKMALKVARMLQLKEEKES